MKHMFYFIDKLYHLTNDVERFALDSDAKRSEANGILDKME